MGPRSGTPVDHAPGGTAADAERTFGRLEADVIQAGLCTHCGTCAGLSGGTLEMRRTPRGPIPSAVSSKTVDLPPAAFDACPGKGLNYPDLCANVFGRQPRSWLVGCYRSMHIGYSCVPRIRRLGASGGVITQTLVYLLERGLIDGAVVVQQGRPRPWQAEPVIATSVDEIVACSQSVYVPVPVNTLLPQMEAFGGKLAYVGLPDQVASLRQLQRLGHAGAGKVEYVLGPYVGMAIYFDAVESYLRSNGVGDIHEVTSLRYREGEWPGCLRIETRSGRVLEASKFYYNYLIPFYVTRSTLHSVDFTNELTDISVGDAWHPRYESIGQGFSVVVVRSEKAEALMSSMVKEGLISLEEVSADEALSMHGHMLDFKKRGAFIRMGWRKALGQPMPDYGYRPMRIPFMRRLAELVIVSVFALCGSRPARKAVEWVPIGILGPAFDMLRKAWKRVSKPTKRAGLHEFEVETWPTREMAAGAQKPGRAAKL